MTDPKDPTRKTVKVEESDDGAYWRVLLASPPGNVIDSAMIDTLTGVFELAASKCDLKAICIDGEGPSFSYGASVAEHKPGEVEVMLPKFHGLFRTILRGSVPLLAAVRGHCLGGAMELVMFAHRVFASPGADFGQPEIKLGVIPPVAAAVLAERVGRSAAEDLCMTGHSVSAGEAVELGLADQLANDPGAAAHDYFVEHFAPLSASSLRYTARAMRLGVERRFNEDIESLERLYLGELMQTSDAAEGIAAFLEKRKPAWKNA